MYRVLLASLLIVVLATLPITASAAPKTDREQFEKRVSKVTDESSFLKKAKHLCVCIEDTTADDERMAGVLVPTFGIIGGDNLRRVQVRCFVRRFNADGSNANSNACSGVWAPLGR